MKVKLTKKKMKSESTTIQDRARENTTVERNIIIDQDTFDRISKYSKLKEEDITERLNILQKKWDIEKSLAVNASSIALASIFLGTFFSKKWFVLTGVVASFLLQHGLQGRGPHMSLFRSMGIRTRKELDEEIYALKVLRGDFDNISSLSQPADILGSFRK